MRSLEVVSAAITFLLLSGCAPFVVQQSARTVRPGSTQAGMSVNVHNFSTQDEEFDSEETQTDIGMSPNAWVRVGLAKNADAGLQFYGSGVRADGKFAPVQSDAFAVAVGAGIGGSYSQTESAADPDFDEPASTDTTSSYWADVGAFFTAGIGPTFDLNVALKFMQGEQYNKEESDDFESTDSTQVRAYGGALGVAIKRPNWTLSPEIAVWQMETYQTEYEDLDPVETLVIVPSVGFSVGF